MYPTREELVQVTMETFDGREDGERERGNFKSVACWQGCMQKINLFKVQTRIRDCYTI